MTFSIKLKIQRDLILPGYLGCGEEDEVNNNAEAEQVTSER